MYYTIQDFKVFHSFMSHSTFPSHPTYYLFRTRSTTSSARIVTTAAHPPLHPTRHAETDIHLGRRRVRLAVDLGLGLARAPVLLRDVGEDGLEVASAAAPGLLCFT